eukprot:TRINITY_DN5171_c0_g1_i1.p1 TRINITY_DN5171_c0_g1~~TRINITY_DN5171_c0_g1_i1.p1  ORF type:complete len:323 (+),score=89.43 TRINITY_DN5171_c0_g1_i1:110-1078(+)
MGCGSSTQAEEVGVVVNEKKEIRYDNTPLSVPIAPKDSLEHTPKEKWMIEFSQVQLQHKIGAGGFGVVYKAIYKDNVVAVKMLHNEQVTGKLYDDFVREAALMVNMEPHPNVIRAFGACVDGEGRPMAIVTEFMEKGSLRSLLDDKSTEITFLQTISIAREIAKGVNHLHSQNIIHRDLSARNILVSITREGWTCKVTDFGMSRVAQDESTTVSNTGPLKWMAPESLREKKYSQKSDSWAFGITLWEILTRQEPYPDLDNVQAAGHVMHKGLRPKAPEDTPLKLCTVIENCTQSDPKDRPKFAEIITILDEVEDDVRSNPFY